mmetsp:Transcript_41467/g.93563  ORF Transcript_41467/g.93563 Transcript_41467/m.93563 type:complete len:235 (-) Transcript_41467:1281-1985(-)
MHLPMLLALLECWSPDPELLRRLVQRLQEAYNCAQDRAYQDKLDLVLLEDRMQEPLKGRRRQFLQARAERFLQLQGFLSVVCDLIEDQGESLPELGADTFPEGNPCLRTHRHQKERLIVRSLILHALGHVLPQKPAQAVFSWPFGECAHQDLGGEDRLRCHVSIYSRYISLTLQEEALHPNSAATEKAWHYRKEYELERNHIGEVADEDATKRQDPPLRHEHPSSHLKEPKEKT